MEKKRSIALILTLTLCFPVFTFAETIILKSGKTVEGKIIGRDDKCIKLDTDGVIMFYYLEDIENIKDAKLSVSSENETSYSQNLTSSEKLLLMGKYTTEGLELAIGGNFKEAEGKFKKLIEIENNYLVQGFLNVISDLSSGKITQEFALYFFKGANYSVQHKYSQAIEEYKRAIQIKPDYALAYYNIATIHESSKEYQKAAEYYEKSVQIDPNDAVMVNHLGSAYTELNRNEEALKYFERAIEINPNYLEAHANLGIAYYRVGRKQEAINIWQKVMQIDPDYTDAYYLCGITYYSLQQYKDAQKNMLKAKELCQSKGDDKLVEKIDAYLRNISIFLARQPE